jgi:branched-subunit amino acid ABC-type transport system permease component
VTRLLEYLVPGIADGSIYAICALGLVLTYKTSGVFNFAHGALAAAAAYAFYQFRNRNHLPWPVAAILALIIVGLIGGLLLERLAGWLSSAPPVTLVVATVGLLVFLQSLATAVYGASNIDDFRPFLPQSGFHVGHVTVSGSDMIIAALALGTAVGLYYFFQRARLGVSMTAVVDDPNLLSLQGVNPANVRRIAWILGATFAGISGELLAPELGVSVNDLILLVITAYGAAAIGLFDSLPLTFLGGLLIGVAVDVLPAYLPSSNVTLQSLPRNIPFLILFAVLVFVPARKFTERGMRNVRRLKPIRQYSLTVMGPAMSLAAVGLIVLPFVINRARVDQYSAALGYAVIFASLGLITWTSGQISLCHLAFAAIGASTMGHSLSAGVPWIFALLFAGLIGIPAGAIVAIPANRLSGVYVAVATFGFGILIQQIFYPTFLMFGVLNNIAVPRPHVLGIGFTGDRAYYYLCLIVTALACASILVVLRSRLGRLLRALSNSPVALDAHGANTNLIRVVVFCFSAFLAAIGGALLAGVPQSASGATGGQFDFTVSLVFVAILAFCGRRPLISPFIAAFLYEVIKIYPFFDNETVLKYQGVAFGLLAIMVAVAPGIQAGRLATSRRSSERDRSPVTQRLDDRRLGPIQPSALALGPPVYRSGRSPSNGSLSNGSSSNGAGVRPLGSKTGRQL